MSLASLSQCLPTWEGHPNSLVALQWSDALLLQRPTPSFPVRSWGKLRGHRCSYSFANGRPEVRLLHGANSAVKLSVNTDNCCSFNGRPVNRRPSSNQLGARCMPALLMVLNAPSANLRAIMVSFGSSSRHLGKVFINEQWFHVAGSKPCCGHACVFLATCLN